MFSDSELPVFAHVGGGEIKKKKKAVLCDSWAADGGGGVGGGGGDHEKTNPVLSFKANSILMRSFC